MLPILFLLVCTQASEPAKAVITDPNGQPLPAVVSLGSALRFSAGQSTFGKDEDGKPIDGAIKWLIEPESFDARKWMPKASLGIEGDVPTGLVPAEITLTLVVGKDNTVDIARIKVKCGEGDIPPPDPDPKPKPNPNPGPTPNNQTVFVAIVADKNLSLEQATTITDLMEYNDKGHTVRRYASDDTTEFGKRVNKDAPNRPSIAIYSTDGFNKLLGVEPLPTRDNIKAVLGKYTSRL